MEEININDLTKINSDVNGNQRYVLHFQSLIHDEDKGSIMGKFNIALNRARKLGGKKYLAKWYGGGIVFQTNNIDILCDRLNELMGKEANKQEDK